MIGFSSDTFASCEDLGTHGKLSSVSLLATVSVPSQGEFIAAVGVSEWACGRVSGLQKWAWISIGQGVQKPIDEWRGWDQVLKLQVEDPL